MRKKSTRLLSAALAVCMMLSVLPVGAFAAEPGAEEQESGVSAQALEGEPLKLKVGQTVKKGGTYLLDGDYTGKYGITIDTSEDVTINIGKVTCAISGGDHYDLSSRELLYVKNVGKLIINGAGGSVEGTAGFYFLSTAGGANMQVYVNGGTYTMGRYGVGTPVFHFFDGSGQYCGKDAYLSGVTAKGESVVDVDGWHVQIDGGSYIGTKNGLEDDEDYGVLRAWGSESVLTVNNAEVSSEYDHVTCLACYGGNAVLNGGTYTSVIANDTQGKMTLNNVNVPSKNRALYNGGEEMTINGGTYSGSQASALYADGYRTYIHGGTFTSSNMDTDEAVLLCIGGTTIIDEERGTTFINNSQANCYAIINDSTLELKAGTVMASQGGAIWSTGYESTEYEDPYFKIDGGTVTALQGDAVLLQEYRNSIVHINAGTITAPNGNAIRLGKKNDFLPTRVQINGGQIVGGTYGVYAEDRNFEDEHGPEIMGGTISGSVADIYLGNKCNFVVSSDYTPELTVQVKDPYHKRNLATPCWDEMPGKTDATNIVLKNEGYRIETNQEDDWYDPTPDEDNDDSIYGAYYHRYLIAQHTVNAVDAEAKVGEQAVTSTDLVDADTTVTVTAKEIPGKTFTDWTVKLNGVKQDNPENILTKPDANDPTKVTFTMPDADVEVTANFKGIPTLNIGDHVTANIKDSDAPVPSGSTVPVGETVHLTATAPEGQHFISWTVMVGGEKADNFLTQDANDPTKATFTMPDKNVEVKANFEGDPTLNIGDHVTANIEGNDASVPSGSTVPVGETVHLTATAPEGQHFISWTVKVNGVKQPDDFLTPDAIDPAKVRFTMPSKNVEVTANFASNPTLRVGDHVTATIEGSDASVPSGSAVPVPKNKIVHLTAIAPEGQHFTGWTVKVGGEEQKADTFLTTPDESDPTKVTFTMPSENVEVTANFASNPTLNPTLRVGDHVTATIEGSDASVPSGSAVPVPKNKIVHLTATAPGQHFISWTVKVNGVEQDPTFLKPDADDPTKVTFTMPDANVEVTATFADDPIPEPDPVGPSDTGNIQGAISAVVIGAAAGAIIYEAGTGIYRVINMPGIPMPSNRIELAELLWEHAGKPEPVSTALYSDIDEGDTDAQKAARWAVEQDLMKDDADNNKFHPAFPVSKLRTCLTWNAAKEKGLFDKTEE